MCECTRTNFLDIYSLSDWNQSIVKDILISEEKNWKEVHPRIREINFFILVLCCKFLKRIPEFKVLRDGNHDIDFVSWIMMDKSWYFVIFIPNYLLWGKLCKWTWVKLFKMWTFKNRIVKTDFILKMMLMDSGLVCDGTLLQWGNLLKVFTEFQAQNGWKNPSNF